MIMVNIGMGLIGRRAGEVTCVDFEHEGRK